ncbi:MAG: zinc ribbon domain-containing protein [Anaerolineae bacterium]|nr:zinc ribbon domain-containing protein [Anaerolineae bacterium]
MVICSNCGSQQPDGAAFCDECGAALSGPPVAGMANPAAGGIPGGIPTVAASLCPVCGAQIAPGEQFCNSCGSAVGSLPAMPGSFATPDSGLPLAAAAAGGRTCPNCGAALEPDSAFCDMCGAPVQAVPATAVGAAAVPPPLPAAYAPPVAGAPAVPGEYAPTMIAQPGQAVYPAPEPGGAGFPQPVAPQPAPYIAPPVAVRGRLLISGSNTALPFPVGKNEVIIGREDPVSGVFPDIDLTDYGGDEGGVSRQHARILVQGERFFIEDLNSTNFTFVNQQKLVPRQPQALASGDEVRFGRIKTTFQI